MTTTPTIPPAACRWAEAAAGGILTAIEPLLGSTSAQLHRLHFASPATHTPLVLRRFTLTDWLLAEPDLAAHEAAALEQASRARLPAPALIGCDPMGEFCDVPAVLMTHLPGRVVLAPADLDRWLQAQAAALHTIHCAEIVNYSWHYYPWHDPVTLRPPTWSNHPSLWENALHLLRAGPPPTPTCFIHRDYHPANLLWEGGRISAIVDWVNACLGPPGIDLGHCRLNLAQLHGPAAAERFLDHYQALNPSYPHHPYWDIATLADILPGPDDVYSGWPAFGVHHLTLPLIRQRLDDYLLAVLAL